MTDKMTTYERHFITHDGGKTFKMVEDECGDVFWGYGHREGPEFIEEVNRWLIYGCYVTHPDDLIALNERVEYLWAKYDDEYCEHFTVVRDYGSDVLKKAADVFPVTRLLLP